MSSHTTKNLYYTVHLVDDLESQDYLQEKKAPWLSVPIRSAAPSRSPFSILKQKLWSWSKNDSHHHNSNHSRSVNQKGFWDRWIWLVHAILLTISMSIFALSMCTLQQTAASTAAAAAAAGAVQCECQGLPRGSQGMTAAAGGVDGTGASSTSSSFVPRSFFDDEKETAPAVVLPVPIVAPTVDIPESKHVDMDVSVDDKTWVEKGEE
ncbi:hypothetical protein QBC32DRAFT_312788 [Pseudoneurospora amorphoporcata]|uniref:Uncharacterized protein n=1 Tax=Pseudoneurospora amorphoporcata TaxID=241081 RepID=A0AAN6NWZ7_9PEZI|nr:hypothetical protein QBC32DRAFT_312788 [Pseudoneurospora amorphoporcata]